jgi:probable rRNA maturation factor
VDDPFSPTGVEAPPEVEIVVSDEQASPDVDADRWAALAAAVLRAEGRGGELTLTFVDRDEIAELNAEHMGQRGPTDVLSFPLDDDPAAIGAGPVLLGDVVICPDVAREAAPDHAGTLDDELALLTVHGVLHILGFDHVDAAERIEMRARERAMLEQHHWRGPAPVAFRHEQADA